MRISADQFIDRPAAIVFDRICTQYFTYQPLWDPALVELERTDSGPVKPGSHARAVHRANERDEPGEAIVVSIESPRGMVVDLTFGKGKERRSITCNELHSGGTRLHVDIDTELRGVAKWVASLASGVLQRGLARSLHEAKVAVEASAEPEPGVADHPDHPLP